MKLGIDKLVLTTTDFSVDDVFHSELKTDLGLLGEPQPHLFTDGAGNVVKARKTWYNQEDSIVNVTINKRGLQVITNPSKHFHRHELMTETEKLSIVADNVVRVLDEVGIKCNIEDARISRLDLAKQAYMPQPVALYGEAFRAVKGKRQEKKDYPDGFYFYNKQHEVCFYDKGKQLSMPKDKNFMRGEVRFKHTRVVQQKTEGIATLRELRISGMPHLNGCYNKYLETQVFGPAEQAKNLEDEMPNILAIASFIKALRASSPKKWHNDFKGMYGIEHILSMVGGVEGYRHVLELAGVPRTSIYNLLEKDKKLREQKGFLDASIGNVTVASMINDVRHMFVA
jgi:hypothetical protein